MKVGQEPVIVLVQFKVRRCSSEAAGAGEALVPEVAARTLRGVHLEPDARPRPRLGAEAAPLLVRLELAAADVDVADTELGRQLQRGGLLVLENLHVDSLRDQVFEVCKNLPPVLPSLPEMVRLPRRHCSHPLSSVLCP